MTPEQPRPWWLLLPPEVVEKYAELVRDTRAIQTQFRRTQCPMLRRELPNVEKVLDASTEQICAAITTAREAERAAAEGGVS